MQREQYQLSFNFSLSVCLFVCMPVFLFASLSLSLSLSLLTLVRHCVGFDDSKRFLLWKKELHVLLDFRFSGSAMQLVDLNTLYSVLCPQTTQT